MWYLIWVNNLMYTLRPTELIRFWLKLIFCPKMAEKAWIPYLMNHLSYEIRRPLILSGNIHFLLVFDIIYTLLVNGSGWIGRFSLKRNQNYMQWHNISRKTGLVVFLYFIWSTRCYLIIVKYMVDPETNRTYLLSAKYCLCPKMAEKA